jgi:Flp pilus assembly protein TadD
MVRTAESDQARLAAVQRANATGDLAAAAALAEAALRDGLAHPMLLGLLAQAREQAGRFEEALALLRRLKAAVPGNAGVIVAIGVSLIRLDRLDEAVAEFGEALAIDPR